MSAVVFMRDYVRRLRSRRPDAPRSSEVELARRTASTSFSGGMLLGILIGFGFGVFVTSVYFALLLLGRAPA